MCSFHALTCKDMNFFQTSGDNISVMIMNFYARVREGIDIILLVCQPPFFSTVSTLASSPPFTQVTNVEGDRDTENL